MRHAGLVAICAAALGAVAPMARAQGLPDTGFATAGQTSPILTLERERLFSGSRFGQRVNAQIEEASRALAAENRQIEADLTAEERSLTDRRASLPPEEFRTLANAFDAKVEGIRRTQDAKARALARTREEEQQKFLQAAVPILGQMTADLGAFAILDRGAVILSFDVIDITDEAIARIDAELGDGSAADASPAPAAPGAPAETPPASAPDAPQPAD